MAGEAGKITLPGVPGMSRTTKKLIVIFALCSAGTLFQVGLVSSGCAQFYGQALLSSFDFCAVFNCTSGSYFNLCEPVPLFADCPNTTDAAP